MKQNRIRNAVLGTIGIILITGVIVACIWILSSVSSGIKTTATVSILNEDGTTEISQEYAGHANGKINLNDLIPSVKPDYRFSGWFEDKNLTIPLVSVNQEGEPVFAKTDLSIYGKLMKEFKLTYQAVGPTVDFDSLPKTIISTEIITLPVIEADGFVFKHYEVSGTKLTNHQLKQINADTLVTAVYVADTPGVSEVTVLVHINNVLADSLVGKPGTTMNLPDTDRPNESFLGWYLESSFTTPFAGGNLFPSTDLNIYAKHVKSNRITYVNGTDYIHSNPSEFKGEDLILKPAYKVGYEFQHWLLNGTITIQPTGVLNGASLIGNDITLEAIFTLNTPTKDSITIIFVDTLGNVESVNVNYDSKVSSAPGLPSNPSKLGYKFLFWSVDGSAEYDLETVITASDLDFNLTAVFDKVLVYLEFIGDDNGVIETTTVLYDSKLTPLPTAPAKTNHKFSHYERVDNQEVVNSQTIFSEINTDTTPLVIKAIYTKVKVNVVLKVPGEIDQTLNGEPGKAMVLPTMVKPGYQFTGWHMDEGLTIKYQSSNFPDQDLTIHGDWLAEVTLTYDSLVTGFTHTNKPLILENEIITLTPAYKTDYEFLGWFNSLDGKIETVDGAGGDQTITAKFKIIPPTRNYITILFVDTLGNVESVNVNYDSKVSSAPGLPSNPSKLGYKFLFWSVDGSAEYDLETLITASDLDFNLTAVFDKVLVYLEFIGDDNSVIETTTVLYDSKLTVLPTAPAKTNHKFSHYERVDNQEVVNSQTIFSEINTDTTPLVIKAIYTKVKVNVVLKVPGEIDQTLNGEPGKAMVLPTMVKPGYQFTGWHMDEGLTIKYQSSNFPDQDLTIHGDWLAEVTLTYDSLVTGFTHTNKPLILENEIITLTPAYKTDYEFLGWFNSLDGKIETVDGAGGDQTITAKFKIIPPTRNYITILFADTLGSVVSVIVPFNTKVSDAPNVPTNPVKLGYEFLYWDNEGELYELETVITETDVDLFLIAIYYAGSVHLLFVDDADGDIIGLQVEYDGKLSSLPAAPALANHQFSHYERVDNQSRVTLETIFSEINEITSPIVIKAKYIKTHVDVTLSVSGEPNQVMNGKPGAAMTLSTPAKPGYQFSGWHLESGLLTPYQSSNYPSDDMTLYGKFILEVTLTYSSSNSGFTHENPSVILENQSIILKDAHLQGYTFTGWLDSNNQPITTVNGSDGTQTITAKFEKTPEARYLITYENLVEAISVIHNNPSYFIVGKNQVLVNGTHLKYVITGWEIKGSGTVVTNTSELPLEDVTLTPVYSVSNLTQYTITFDSQGGQLVSSLPYQYGEAVTLPNGAWVDSSQTFVNWKDSKGNIIQSIDSSNPLNYQLVASYRPSTYQISFEAQNGVSYGGVEIAHGGLIANQPLTPKREGYQILANVFINQADSSEIDLTTYQVIGNLTLRPKYEIINYTVTFNLTDSFGNKATLDPSQLLTYNIENNLNLLPSTHLGYNQIAYTTDGTNRITEISGVGNKQVDLVFSDPKSIAITYQNVLGSSNGINPTTYIYGVEAIISPITKAGYEFGGFTSSWNHPNKVLVGTIIPVEFTATLTIITYQIIYKANAAGHTEKNTLTSYTVESPNYTFKAPEHDGYRFVEYVVNGLKVGNSYEFKPSEHLKTVDVEYRFNLESPITFQITYEAVLYENGSQVDYVNDAALGNMQTFLTIETQFFLKDISHEHMVFIGWYDKFTGGLLPSIDKGTTRDMNLQARFEYASYDMTFDANGSSFKYSGVSTASIYVVYGKTPQEHVQELSLNNLDISIYIGNYKFSGWYNEGIKLTQFDKDSINKVWYAQWQDTTTGEFKYEYNATTKTMSIVGYHNNALKNAKLVFPNLRHLGYLVTRITPTVSDDGTTVTGPFNNLIYNSLVFMEGFDYIGAKAFKKATFASAAPLSFPTTIKEIAGEAFMEMKKISGIVLNEGLQTIGSNAFRQGTDGTANVLQNRKLVLPSTLLILADRAFAYVPFTEVDLSLATELKTISAYAFSAQDGTVNKTIAQLKFASGGKLETIGEGAFYSQPVTTLTFPNSLQTIQANAFRANLSLFEVYFGTGIRSIGVNSFIGNRLLDFTLDFSKTRLESIGQGAFADPIAVGEVVGTTYVLKNVIVPPAVMLNLGFAAFGRHNSVPVGTRTLIVIPLINSDNQAGIHTYMLLQYPDIYDYKLLTS